MGKDQSGKKKKVRLPVVQAADYRGKALEKIEKGYTKATAALGGAVTREVALVGSMFLEQGKALSFQTNSSVEEQQVIEDKNEHTQSILTTTLGKSSFSPKKSVRVSQDS